MGEMQSALNLSALFGLLEAGKGWNFFMKQENRVVKFLFILVGLATLTPWVNAPMALIGGYLFAQFLGNPLPMQSAKVSSLLLKIAIIGLGFGISLQTALEAGRDGFWLTFASIVTILVLGAVGLALLGAYTDVKCA